MATHQAPLSLWFSRWKYCSGLTFPSPMYARWDLIAKIAHDWANKLLGGTNKTLWTPGPSRKKQWPLKRLSQTCLWVLKDLWWRWVSTVSCNWVRGPENSSPGSYRLCWYKSFWIIIISVEKTIFVYLFPCGSPVFQHFCWESCFFSILLPWLLCQKSGEYIYGDLFLDFLLQDFF